MNSKVKKTTKRPLIEYPRKAVPFTSGPSVEERGKSYAKLITSPELSAFRLIRAMQPNDLTEAIDTPTLLELLQEQATVIQRGDLAQAEAMLINQALALQSMFVRLSERAIEQTLMPHYEGFMKLALRAQSQCRATLETLSAIKNPPVVYARQANVTTGPQQINNGTVEPRVREIQN